MNSDMETSSNAISERVELSNNGIVESSLKRKRERKKFISKDERLRLKMSDDSYFEALKEQI